MGSHCNSELYPKWLFVSLNLRCLSFKRQVDCHQFDGQLFQEMKGFSGAGRTDLALDDVVFPARVGMNRPKWVRKY